MRKSAAKQNDTITATDMHNVVTANGTVMALPHPFVGRIQHNLSPNVRIMGAPAATVGSLAINEPPHFPASPGVSFQLAPSNRGVVISGSNRVFINGQRAARANDVVETCADPLPNRTGQLAAQSTVMIGD